MIESYTVSNCTSDTDLPKFKLAELRRVLELLESLAVVLSTIRRWPVVDRSRVGWGQDRGSIATLMGDGE